MKELQVRKTVVEVEISARYCGCCPCPSTRD
jgi:hypothetical protein